MKFSQYSEPATSNYIYVDGRNIVHFFMPLIKGGSSANRPIGTDNTCQAAVAMQNFFGFNNPSNANDGICALKQYKEYLLHDIDLDLFPQITQQKRERLVQIEAYIQALTTIKENSANTEALRNSLPQYPAWAESFLTDRTNLLSMCLRPIQQDPLLRFAKPVFSVNRSTSSFFNAMVREYRSVTIKKQSPQMELAAETVKALGESEFNFQALQDALKAKAIELYNVKIDFTYSMQPEEVWDGSKNVIRYNKVDATKAYFDNILAIDPETKIDEARKIEYAEGLIRFCSENHWKTLPTPPFLIKHDYNTCSKLIVLTQFFLAEANIHCYANRLSFSNFGSVLDVSETLSNNVARIVKANLANGNSVERALFDFINANYRTFGLSAKLNDADFNQININFTQDYNTLKEAPHFDEFLILVDRPGVAKSHQGNICIPFANVVSQQFSRLDNPHFRRARRQQLPHVVPHKNESLNEIDDAEVYTKLISLVSNGNIDSAVRLLMAPLENNQFVFEKLDTPTKFALFGSPHWERLNTLIQTRISPDATLEKYQANLSFYTLTTSQVACLHYKAVANGLYAPTKFSEITADQLKALLADNLECNMFVKNTPNGAVINLPLSEMDPLTELLNNNQNQLHCTEAMVGLLYQEAVRIHGADSAKIVELNEKTDSYLRLDATLQLLKINFAEIITQDNSPNVVIKTTSSVGIMRLLNILQQKSKFDAAVKKLEDHAQTLEQQGDAEAHQAATALVSELKQHGNDYFLNKTINYPRFRSLCHGSIESKRKVLEIHHGWKAILAGFLKVINTLIYPLTLFTNNTFFKMAPTESIGKIEVFNEELETAFNQEHTLGA